MSLRDRLDGLDARYARTGPLALLREVPQLAMLLVAVVFFAGTGVALSRSGDDGERGGGVSRPVLQSPSDLVLGPEVGERVDTYLADARSGLVRALQVSPGTGRVALVTLRGSLTVRQATALTAGLRVNRVYLRAAAAGRPETVAVPVQDLARDVPRAYVRLAQRKGAEARALRLLAGSIDRRSLPQDRAAADEDARVVERERAAYASGCACVMAIVVTGPPGLLVELAGRRGVAAVQVARSASLRGLAVRPLAPQAARGGVVRSLPLPPGGATGQR